MKKCPWCLYLHAITAKFARWFPQLVKRGEQMVGVSLPSLRLDSFSVELADIVTGVRLSGLTFVPEAVFPRLRAVINKWIPDEEWLSMSQQAYQLGWDHVKLYFMIGLPTGREDDVDAIADLTLRTFGGRSENQSKSHSEYWSVDVCPKALHSISVGISN